MLPGIARLRALSVAVITAALVLTATPAVPTTPVAAAASKTTTARAQQVIAIATAKVGAPYLWGTAGPSTFDCSGLVIYAFRKAGIVAKVGNGNARSAAAMYQWFRSRGLADRSNPQPGDIVVWGGGTHVGIYIGNGKAVSALTQGVRIHAVSALVDRFTAYLHTDLGQATTTKPIVKSAPKAKTATVNVYLNFRTGPSTNRSVIRVLRPGTVLVVLGSRKDAQGRTWLNVSLGKKHGWVAAWLTTR